MDDKELCSHGAKHIYSKNIFFQNLLLLNIVENIYDIVV